MIIVRVLCIRSDEAHPDHMALLKMMVSPLIHLKYIYFYSILVESKSLVTRGKDMHQNLISFNKFKQLRFEHQCRGSPVGTACLRSLLHLQPVLLGLTPECRSSCEQKCSSSCEPASTPSLLSTAFALLEALCRASGLGVCCF